MRQPKIDMSWVAAAAMASLLVAGCAGASTVATNRVPSTTQSLSTDSNQISATAYATGSAPAAPTTPASPTSSTVSGGSRSYRGAVLPNTTRTPGARNPEVTQASIGRTICVSGWTATIRPPSSYTTSLKERQLATGYAWHRDTNPADYEEDHLISLELGGSATSEKNLWPEPYAATDGARVKDKIENKLHALVCAHTLSLATAQRAIALNWYAAYVKDGNLTVTPPRHQTSHPANPPAPAAPPAGATALCNDGTYSYAQHHQGACSHHGGVATFYN